MRILVVEDNKLIATSLIHGLEENGFDVEHAAYGGAAWAALQISSWDLVILDWWLPDEDGVAVLQRFRRRDQHTPVLLLTARDSVSDRIHGLESGANDYLCKPFVFGELLARLNALLRRQEDCGQNRVAHWPQWM
jgi:DNA-binding response OmpR family regulator